MEILNDTCTHNVSIESMTHDIVMVLWQLLREKSVVLKSDFCIEFYWHRNKTMIIMQNLFHSHTLNRKSYTYFHDTDLPQISAPGCNRSHMALPCAEKG